MQLIFDAAPFTPEQIAAIKLPCDELRAHEFRTLEAAEGKLKPSLYRRLQQAVAARTEGTHRYTEFGRLLS